MYIIWRLLACLPKGELRNTCFASLSLSLSLFNGDFRLSSSLLDLMELQYDWCFMVVGIKFSISSSSIWAMELLISWWIHLQWQTDSNPRFSSHSMALQQLNSGAILLLHGGAGFLNHPQTVAMLPHGSIDSERQAVVGSLLRDWAGGRRWHKGLYWPLRDLLFLCNSAPEAFCAFADCELAPVTFYNFTNRVSALRTFPDLSEIAMQPCNFVIQHL